MTRDSAARARTTSVSSVLAPGVSTHALKLTSRLVEGLRPASAPPVRRILCRHDPVSVLIQAPEETSGRDLGLCTANAVLAPRSSARRPRHDGDLWLRPGTLASFGEDGEGTPLSGSRPGETDQGWSVIWDKGPPKGIAAVHSPKAMARVKFPKGPLLAVACLFRGVEKASSADEQALNGGLGRASGVEFFRGLELLPVSSTCDISKGSQMSSKVTEFGKLLEAVPDALVGVDRAGMIQYVNRQAESLFGYDCDQLIGQPIEILVPESVRQEHPAHREGYLAGLGARRWGLDREATIGQHRVLSPACLRARQRDGTEFSVNISLSHIDAEDGLMVIAAVRDVTQQKEAVKNAQLIEAIVAYSDDAIIGKTLDGVITSWNPAAQRMYGYSGEEIIGRSVELLSPPGRAGEMVDILSRIRAGQHLDHFETLRVRQDATVFPVSLSVSPICDVDGAVIGASTIAHDLTKARQTVDAARSMIEASLDSLVAISPEGQITDANQATVKVTGVPRDMLIGTSFSDYFTDPEKANEIYQLVFTQGMAVDYPLTLRHRNGTLTEVLYNASVYRDVSGKVLGVFAAARDMTSKA